MPTSAAGPRPTGAGVERTGTDRGGVDRGGGNGRTGGAAGAEGEAARGKRPARRADTERGLRGIVGSGPSQVGVAGAMRARDAARPTAADLAAAERDLVIVRRHYVPPDPEPR